MNFFFLTKPKSSLLYLQKTIRIAIPKKNCWFLSVWLAGCDTAEISKASAMPTSCLLHAHILCVYKCFALFTVGTVWSKIMYINFWLIFWNRATTDDVYGYFIDGQSRVSLIDKSISKFIFPCETHGSTGYVAAPRFTVYFLQFLFF